MTDPATALAKLDQHAAELDELSKALAVTERKLEPVETAYDEAIEDYICGLWDEHLKGEKLPAAEIREALARRAMASDLKADYTTLRSKRQRLEKRLTTLRSLVDAQRSVVAALRAELEATR